MSNAEPKEKAKIPAALRLIEKSEEKATIDDAVCRRCERAEKESAEAEAKIVVDGYKASVAGIAAPVESTRALLGRAVKPSTNVRQLKRND